jgi:acetylornithine deacetylase/succinyl-diaminopimelate desuccinylase-like protein
MTTEETSHRIGLDCFYEGKQVKDKKSTLYTLFSKHVLEEVKKKFVVAAHKGGITYNEKVEGFDGRVGYRVKQVVEPIDIATAFNQIPTNEVNNNLVAYQNKLYDIMYQEFGKNWDDPLEKKILHELGYSYSETNRERIQAGIKKGDVRKMITTKYREVRKYIFQTIEKVHGRGKLNISRSRVNGSEKDGKLIRGGREKRKFYANASARKVKVNGLNVISLLVITSSFI